MRQRLLGHFDLCRPCRFPSMLALPVVLSQSVVAGAAELVPWIVSPSLAGRERPPLKQRIAGRPPSRVAQRRRPDFRSGFHLRHRSSSCERCFAGQSPADGIRIGERAGPPAPDRNQLAVSVVRREPPGPLTFTSSRLRHRGCTAHDFPDRSQAADHASGDRTSVRLSRSLRPEGPARASRSRRQTDVRHPG